MSDYIKPVVFKVGNEMYGVDINLVQSIEREIQVVPVPNSMPYIKGIVNLRSDRSISLCCASANMADSWSKTGCGW